MTYYHQCFGCSVDPTTCERRAELKKAISGAGITSIKFACQDRKPMFSTGQRVSTCLIIERDGERCEVIFDATVIKESKKGRYLIRIDDGIASNTDFEDWPVCPEDLLTDGTFPISASRLSLKDEPAQAVCGICGESGNNWRGCFAGPFSQQLGCLHPSKPPEGAV